MQEARLICQELRFTNTTTTLVNTEHGLLQECLSLCKMQNAFLISALPTKSKMVDITLQPCEARPSTRRRTVCHPKLPTDADGWCWTGADTYACMAAWLCAWWTSSLLRIYGILSQTTSFAQERARE